MANPNAPFGFRPVRRLDGAMPNYQTNRYLISLSNTNRIATGDVVKYDGTNAGYVDKAGATDTPILGIFAGCEWFDSSQNKKIFSPQWTGTTSVVTGTLIQAYVYDDVQIVFEVQSGSGTVVPQSACRQNAKYSGSAGGASPFVIGLSVETLDDANVATNQATYPFKIVELSQKVGNDNTVGYNIVEVVINASNYKTGVA